MIVRLVGEAMLASGLSAVDMRKAVALEKRVAGGKAFTVRSMISRQMLMALMHRKMKQMKEARS